MQFSVKKSKSAKHKEQKPSLSIQPSERDQPPAQHITALSDNYAEPASESERSKLPRSEHSKPVIPVRPGTYEQRFRPSAQPSFVPNSSAERSDKSFVRADDGGMSSAAANIEYGLNKRKREHVSHHAIPDGNDKNDETITGGVKSSKERAVTDVSLGPEAGEQRERDDLQQSLQTLPDAPSEEAYSALPVEQFGEAMLRGMGWQPGQERDQKGRKIAKPTEYIPRTGQLGLGASSGGSDQQNTRKRPRKPGEEREADQKPDALPEREKKGVRHFQTLDEHDSIEKGRRRRER